MDQHTQLHNRKRKTLFLTLIALAVVAIITSVVVIVNPHPNETADIGTSAGVTITERSTAPSIITIKKGTSVTWTNQGDAAHSLALTSPNPPQELQGFGTSDPIAKGESYSFTFDATGTYTYDDPQSPEHIKGTIIVE